MILSYTYPEARIMLCSTLTNNNIPRPGKLASVNFYAQTFAVRFPAVRCATRTFFVCHETMLVLKCYCFDLNFCKGLAVAVQLSVSFSSFLLENDKFVCFHMFNYLSAYFCAFKHR